MLTTLVKCIRFESGAVAIPAIINHRTCMMKDFIPLELSRVDAARRLGVGQRTFDRYVSIGLIKPARYVGKFPRYSREQIDKFDTLTCRPTLSCRPRIASMHSCHSGQSARQQNQPKQ